MNEKVKRVFTGWLSLSSLEKQELTNEINTFQRKSINEQREFIEKAGVVTGPIGGSCPCCGR